MPCNIDWTAVGAIGAWAAMIASTLVAVLLYSLQKKMAAKESYAKEVELKILLFDKRFSVYSCLKRYVVIIPVVQKNKHGLNLPFGEVTLQSFMYKLLFEQRNNKRNVVDEQFNYIESIFKLFDEDNKTVEVAKFCFEIR